MRRNIKDNVQNAVSKTVADFVSRTLAVFHDKALVRTIETEVGNNAAELEDEFEHEFDSESDDRFDTEIVVRSVAGYAAR